MTRRSPPASGPAISTPSWPARTAARWRWCCSISPSRSRRFAGSTGRTRPSTRALAIWSGNGSAVLRRLWPARSGAAGARRRAAKEAGADLGAGGRRAGRHRRRRPRRSSSWPACSGRARAIADAHSRWRPRRAALSQDPLGGAKLEGPRRLDRAAIACEGVPHLASHRGAPVLRVLTAASAPGARRWSGGAAPACGAPRRCGDRAARRSPAPARRRRKFRMLMSSAPSRTWAGAPAPAASASRASA